MKIPINIKIETERVSPPAAFGEENLFPEVNVVNVSGYMKRTRQGLQLEYIEHPDSGMGKTVTTISALEDSLVSVNRVGPVNSHMVFERGKCHTCVYDTGFFPMQLRVCTKELENNLTIDGGKLQIDYSVEIVGNLAEENKLKLSVHPTESLLIS